MKLISIFFILYCILLSSCDKCNDQQLPRESFTLEELSVNPYKEGDQAVFSSNNGENNTLRCYRRLNNTQVTELDANQVYDCKGQWYYSEWDECFLAKNNEPPFIIIKMFLPNYFRNYNFPNFQIQINDPVDTIGDFGNHSEIRDSLLVNIEEILPISSIVSINDSVSFNGKTFRNVYKIHQQKGMYNIWIEWIYYSTREGIVGLVYSNGDYVYLNSLTHQSEFYSEAPSR